ncbi:hypothetical protein [Maribacter sp. 2308TA10-17]|uniref:hypothetical protein n=1 Tax=Maribacter sp. 2308TA10-17 TaxID=3386276 RepID=UPI0039BC7272
MNYKVSFVVLFFSVSCFLTAQTKFERGYVINKRGDSISGYIKNLKWLSAPKTIQFKSDLNADEQKLGVDFIQKFQVVNGPLYLAFSDSLPVTQQFVENKTIEKYPRKVFKKGFVKQILEGEGSLYEYRADNDLVFFVSKGLGKMEPLEYKQYSKPPSNENAENPIFRRQLFKFFNCNNTLSIQEVLYTKSSLIDYLTGYNICSRRAFEGKSILNKSEKQKAELRVIVFGGLVSYKFNTTLQRIVGSGFDAIFVPIEPAFESKISPSLGVELESIFPFNNGKWSTFVSAQFAKYSAVGILNSQDIASIDLNQLIFNLGGRHYMFLNEKNSIHIAGGIVFDFNLNAEFKEAQSFITPLTDITKVNFGAFIGGGYSFNQSIYVTGKYFLGASVNTDAAESNNLERFTVSVGFKL